MSRGISTKSVGKVWLVWDGFGGCVFTVCATRADAKRIKRFHNDSASIQVLEFDVRSSRWMTDEEMRPHEVRVGHEPVNVLPGDRHE